MRSHAQRNHDRILEVAYQAFSDDPEVSMNSIAKLAGVGAGTLYRNFPTREDLLLAVYGREVRALVDSVEQTLAEHEPLEAFRVWFLRLADYVRIKHGLGEALHTAAAQDAINETAAPVTVATAELLAACEAAGQVRSGLDAADVLLVMGFLWRVGADEAGRQQAERIFDLVVDGLRAHD
jgi:AcrR family transcriptional regulator